MNMQMGESKRKKVAVIGGGAAGFFAAINLCEQCPQTSVTIFEKGSRVLRKVAVSGGGRCNCTNTFEGVSDLRHVYPRGHRLMSRLFKVFDYRDAYQWFERHGIPLTVQADHCVFPASQDAQSIVNCFVQSARDLQIEIRVGTAIDSMDMLEDYDDVVLTVGGFARPQSYDWISLLGVDIVRPVPSLFTLNIADRDLCQLMGTVAENALLKIPGTKFESCGPLLITHWGVSGPAVLKLSSLAARHLYDCNYQTNLCVNWTGQQEQTVREELRAMAQTQGGRQVANCRPGGLSSRLWDYLVEKSLGNKARMRWGELGQKDLNRLTNVLTSDTLCCAGRGTFKEEFVTCGGVSLGSINSVTLSARSNPHLYFAGEVLDIDGVTGGFNLQAAWTTAWVVAQSVLNA